MNTTASSTELVIAGLQRQLFEAEETLRAIREGEIDALVVRGLSTDEVFTIESADSYRNFMEAMEPGAAALDGSGRVLYANTTLTRLLDTPISDLQGKLLQSVFDPKMGSALNELLVEARIAPHSREIRFEGGTSDLHFIVSATPLRLGTVKGFAVTFAEVTARVRAEAAERSERVARAIIASANEAVLVCDTEGVITHVNAASSALCNGNMVGVPFATAVPLIFPGTGVMRAEDVVHLAMSGAPLRGIEVVAPDAPGPKEYIVSAAPLQVAGDQISGCVITLVDVSLRKAAEKQQLLLMDELNHRVRNTLALVLSISSRTFRSENTLEGFQKAFTGRIRALAATHTLLADRAWTNLSVDDIVRSEIAPYVGSNASRVFTKGLNVAVTPRAAIALGLIVHELTTNAVKYGALSCSSGSVSVSAIGRTEDGRGPFVIEWRESGGPSVLPPVRKGFGDIVISRSLEFSPQGGAVVEFHPAGVICRIAIPGEDVR